MATTLILGAGFGGITCANALRSLLGREHRVVLVDKAASFHFGATKPWVAIGSASARQVTHSLVNLHRRGIELAKAEVRSIDPSKRSVETSKGPFEGDYLVVALGADYAMWSIPGLAEAAYSFYSLEEAIRLHNELPKFSAGRFLLLVPRAPFKCPPAPYEAAFLFHDHFKRKGLLSNIEMSVITVEGRPMATAGPDIGDFVMEELKARRIAYQTLKRTARVDAASKSVHFEDGSTADYDFLVAVPPHVAPGPVRNSGLTYASGWIPADPRTCRVAGHRGLFAIGDVAVLPLPGRFKPDAPLVLPKAGTLAAGQAQTVAKLIAAEVLGRSEPAEFDGKGFCYIEMGDMHAVKGEGEFFAMPAPTMKRRVPDMAQYDAKKAWMADWVRENLS